MKTGFSVFELLAPDQIGAIPPMTEVRFAALINNISFNSPEIRDNPELLLPLIGIWMSVNPGQTEIVASVLANMERFSTNDTSANKIETETLSPKLNQGDNSATKEQSNYPIPVISAPFILFAINSIMFGYNGYRYLIMDDQMYKIKFFLCLLGCHFHFTYSTKKYLNDQSYFKKNFHYYLLISFRNFLFQLMFCMGQ